MRTLVTSTQDPASLTIRDILIEDYDFIETGATFEGSPILSNGEAQLITTTKDLIFTEHLAEHFETDAFIYCSRHRSQSGKPALLVHSTGNWTDATEFGGAPRQLSMSVGSLGAVALRELWNQREERGLEHYDVTLEVTHHGPTGMNVPLVFVELGSDLTHWRDREGASCVAAAVMKCIRAPLQQKVAIGFGGNHYASKFTRLVFDHDAYFGHIAPKHALDTITEDLILQMMHRAAEAVHLAVIDWKGTNSQQKEHLFEIFDRLGLEYVRAKNYQAP